MYASKCYITYVLFILDEYSGILFVSCIDLDRQIKMLSPRMNALFAAGCCICYGAVTLMAIDTNLTITPIVQILCQANVWFLCLGFTLAFGSLFSKMWRVYRVFAIKSVKRVVSLKINYIIKYQYKKSIIAL